MIKWVSILGAIFLLTLPSLHSQGHLSIPEGHNGPVSVVCFSPLGDEVLTASRDQTIKIWDARTGLQKQVLHGHTSWVLNAAYSPDGRHVLSSGKDFTLRLWEPATGRLLRTFHSAPSLVLDIAFANADQAFLACMDGKVRLLDIQSGEVLYTLGKEGPPVSAIALFGAGQLLAGSWDGGLRLWGLENRELLRQYRTPLQEATCIAVKDEGRFFTGDVTGRIYGWAQESEQPLWSVNAHKGSVTGLVADPAVDPVTLPGRLASIGKDGKLNIWEDREGNGLQRLRQATAGDNWALGLAYSPGGRQLAGCFWDGDAAIWDAFTGSLLQELKPRSVEVLAAGLSGDGKYALIGGKDYSVRFLNLATGRQEYAFHQHLSWVTDAAFSPDGSFFASASLDNTVKLTRFGASGPFQVFEEEGTKGITHLCFWPDGSKLAYLLGDTLTVREVESGRVAMRLPLRQAGRPSALDISPRDSSLLVAIDSVLVLWDNRGEEVFRRKVHDLYISAASFSPDGRYILTASADGAIKIWGGQNRRMIQQLSAGGPVTAAVFTGNENKFISGTEDGKLQLWEVEKMGPAEVFSGLDSRVSGLAAQNGILFSWEEGSEVNIWRLPEKKMLASYFPLSGQRFLTLLPSGYYTCSNSREMLDELGFIEDQKAYPLALADVQYNRPDLVVEAMPAADTFLLKVFQEAYQARLEEIGLPGAVFSDTFHLPEAIFTNAGQVPFVTGQQTLNLKVQAADSRYRLRSVTVTNFGIRQFEQVFPDSLNIREWESIVTLTLAPGENELAVRAVNEKGFASPSGWIKVNYQAEKKPPDLYVLSIGVGQFEDREFELARPAEDARLVADILKQSTSFGNVYAEVLLDEGFTRETLKKLLQEWNKLSANDVMLVYYSGFGSEGENGEYYLATSHKEAPPAEEKAIPFSWLEETLGSLPPLRKLFLMDVYQLDNGLGTGLFLQKEGAGFSLSEKRPNRRKRIPAGVIRQGLSPQKDVFFYSELFAGLEEASGASVLFLETKVRGGFSAAMLAGLADRKAEGWEMGRVLQRLQSQDLGLFNKGVFAHAFSKGLREGEADANGDRLITAKEIGEYISQTVSELTGGVRRPKWLGSPPRLDFPIWKVE